jgi:ABC-type transport system involved in multi-copper enzyme maturation permease subunit
MVTRLSKEVRLLAAPAALVLAATVLPLAWNGAWDSLAAPRGWWLHIVVLGFYLGTALLVALPFGAEFQQRTIPLLLSQPASRARLWIEKWGVLVAVLAIVAVVQYAAFRMGPLAGHAVGRELGFLVVMACSGLFWTLLAGSTTGGLAFSLAALMLLEMGSNLVVGWISEPGLELFAGHPAIVVVRIAYAMVTLWLGWRLFSRFEVKGHGADIGMQSLGASGALGWLRCRPTGVLLNLVRKELRLQLPTLLIAGLFVVCWLATIAFFAITGDRALLDNVPRVANIAFTVLLTIYLSLALVVAGTISVAEDTSLGILPWHLTLPISSFVQWLVKLGVTAAVVAALVVALPLMMVKLAAATATLPAGMLQLPAPPALLLFATGALVISFWSATLVGHTVKAAVASGLAMLGLAVCGFIAGWAGQRWGIGTDLMTRFMVDNQLPPSAFLPIGTTGRRVSELFSLASFAALALLALRQSLSAYRTVQIDNRRIARYAAQLGIVVLVLAFIPSAYMRAAVDQFESGPVRELEAALQQVSVASRAASGRVPDAVSAGDLEATGLLSETTSRWLAGSEISLRPSSPARDGTTYVRTRVSFTNGRAFRTFYRLPPAK